MIVRIMGEGQFQIDEQVLVDLNRIDAELDEDIQAGNTETFGDHLEALHQIVRTQGTPLDDDEIKPSDIVLPAADSSLDEVLDLLGEEGLVPDHG